MAFSELKRLRKDNNLTLKELSSRVGYGTGNLSSYENNKLRARDATLIRILTKGYFMSKKKAKQVIASWRQAELEETYKVKLAQVSPPYNPKEKKRPLVRLLEEEGLNRKSIVQVKKLIEKLRKKK